MTLDGGQPANPGAAAGQGSAPARPPPRILHHCTTNGIQSLSSSAKSQFTVYALASATFPRSGGTAEPSARTGLLRPFPLEKRVGVAAMPTKRPGQVKARRRTYARRQNRKNIQTSRPGRKYWGGLTARYDACRRRRATQGKPAGHRGGSISSGRLVDDNPWRVFRSRAAAGHQRQPARIQPPENPVLTAGTRSEERPLAAGHNDRSSGLEGDWQRSRGDRRRLVMALRIAHRRTDGPSTPGQLSSNRQLSAGSCWPVTNPG